MKLLLVSPRQVNDGKSAPQGGIGTWTEIFLQVYDKREHYVEVVNISPIGKRRKQVNSKRNLLEEIVRTKRIFASLSKTLKSQRFDVTHINSACGTYGIIRDYLCAKRIKKNKVKVVTHFRCDIEFQIGHNRIARRYLRKLINITDELLVLCENSRKFINDNYLRDAKKVQNFIDGSILCSKDHIIREKIEKAFFVGYIQKEKGCFEIFEIAKRFPDIQFVLAGLVQKDFQILKKPENIQLLGGIHKDEVFRRMDEADIFIFPTHSEGFSNALAEAMARGLPIITTPVGANSDMIEDKGGIITEVGDVAGIEQALLTMMSPEVRKQMSIWNVNKVRNYYTADRVVEKLFKIYKEVTVR